MPGRLTARAIIMPPMPELRPFRGVRYSPMGPLKDLVCPPYDIISPEEQIQLHERHPYNAVRIELPFSETAAPAARYERAARQFREWIESGVLVTDDAPRMYVYRQDYVSPEGARGRVAGVIGALRLEDFGRDSGVLPHERTMPGPVEDRLALLRACPVNISPIYAIYRGGGTLAPYFESLAGRPPDARFVDDAGTLHRLWAVGLPAETRLLADALRPGPLVIADGHHRYETALAYHAEQTGAPGGHDAVMCFCVDADAEDLVVLPFHRAIRAAPLPDRVAERLIRRFGGRRVEPGSGSEEDHRIVFVFPRYDIAVAVPAEDIERRLRHRSGPWRSLDAVALHEIVLPDVLPEGSQDLMFTRDAAEVRRLVASGNATTGVLLRAPRAADVIDVARSGERMPQKTSYFWPKAVTGLVFRTLR
jgi:uncharacterized protein (DUF1015 family)